MKFICISISWDGCYNLTNGFARDLQLFQTERIRFNLNAAEISHSNKDMDFE